MMLALQKALERVWLAVENLEAVVKHNLPIGTLVDFENRVGRISPGRVIERGLFDNISILNLRTNRRLWIRASRIKSINGCTEKADTPLPKRRRAKC